MIKPARIWPLAAAVLAVGFLGGCAAEQQLPAGAPSIAQTEAPSDSPTPAPAPSPSAGATADGILGIVLGEPFDDTVARVGATPQEGCERVATVEGAEFQLQLQRPDPAGAPPSPVEAVSISAPVGNAAQGQVGPRTAEGIGIGSTLDDAFAAYPDAEEIETPDGVTSYLKVATGPGLESLFLAYSEGTAIIWGLTATTLQAPPYEPCS